MINWLGVVHEITICNTTVTRGRVWHPYDALYHIGRSHLGKLLVIENLFSYLGSLVTDEDFRLAVYYTLQMFDHTN